VGQVFSFPRPRLSSKFPGRVPGKIKSAYRMEE